MDKKEFISNILKLGSRKHRVSNSNGSKEAWRWLKKNKWLGLPPITEGNFGMIINEINKKYQEYLCQSRDVKFPHGLGRLELRKYKTDVKIVNGKIVNNMPIDWKETLNLWYEDEESKAKKQLVKRNPGYVFSIYYNRIGTTFKNRLFYQFFPTRALKVRLKELINQGRVDAFLFK